MITRYQNTVGSGGPGHEKKEERQAGNANDESCRCKETSALSPRELLRLMMHDLAFWKKEKK